MQDHATGLWTLPIEDFDAHKDYYLNCLKAGIATSFELTADPELELPCLAIVPIKNAPEQARSAPIYAIGEVFQFAAFGVIRSGTGGKLSRGRGPEAYAIPMVTLDY